MLCESLEIFPEWFSTDDSRMIYACFEPVYLCHGSEFAELWLQMPVLPSFLTLSVRIHLGQLKCFDLLSDLSGVTDLTMNKLSQVLKDTCSQLADESLSAVLCSCLPSFPSEADWTLKPGK